MPFGELLKKIKDEFGGSAVENALMSERTTFKVGGPADLLVAPRSVEGLQKLVCMAGGSGLPVLVFSGGSNLLVRDGGIRGLVIDMSKGFEEMEFSEEPDGSTNARVGASVCLADLVEESARRGLAGLEWAAGIPGTVGGGIRGNAGTRDGDFSRAVLSVDLVDDKGDLVTLKRSAIPFRYRSMGLMGRFIIVSGLLRLTPGDPAKIREAIDKMIRWRTSRQPYESACAGSIFKNPDQAPAGRLIDKAGLKGARVGGAQVSELHTNFIINTGGAKAADIIELIGRVQARVLEVHGVKLETEVIVVGEP